MERYRNLSGDSGVIAYRLSRDSIAVEFRGGAIYLYDFAVPGRREVEEMTRLAIAGRGLSTYISRAVGERYAEKVR